MNTQPTPSMQPTLTRQRPLAPAEVLLPAANAARFASLPHPDASEPVDLVSVAIRGYN